MTTTATPVARRSGTLALRDGRALRWSERPLIMGVLNITPDSFSDGGSWLDPVAAVDHAQQMIDQGADILDLGAESTRPGGGVYGRGAEPVSAAAEMDRLLPVLERLRARVSVPISVDTRKGVVAHAVLAAGADLINDISALADPELAAAVAESHCPVVLMHSRGSLASMQSQITFDDVAIEVAQELTQAVEAAAIHGISRRQIVVDPGIGFGKTTKQNLELLRRLDVLASLNLPVLIGASRKSFIGDIAGVEAKSRVPGSLAAVGWAAHHGAAILRVHDVAETHQFLSVWQAIESVEGIEE